MILLELLASPSIPAAIGAGYHSPALQRFISEDPVRAGANYYHDAKDTPLTLVDPSGLDSTHRWNTHVGRSVTDGPTNRNRRGKNRSGAGILLRTRLLYQLPTARGMATSTTSGITIWLAGMVCRSLYREATVDKTEHSILPNAGVVGPVYELTGAMVGGPNSAPRAGSPA
jgi:hypothetical protein